MLSARRGVVAPHNRETNIPGLRSFAALRLAASDELVGIFRLRGLAHFVRRPASLKMTGLLDDALAGWKSCPSDFSLAVRVPLYFRRGALRFIPAHSFAAAVGEVDHMSGGGGVVSDLGSFVGGLTSADGIDEVRDM